MKYNFSNVQSRFESMVMLEKQKIKLYSFSIIRQEEEINEDSFTKLKKDDYSEEGYQALYVRRVTLGSNNLIKICSKQINKMV